MRPIDADALKETISKYKFTAPNKMYQHGGECALNFYMPKIIDDAPTIETEPVRHREWKKIQNFARCSECMHEINWGSKDFLSPYCPNCGAKMDGGKEKNET